MLLYIVYIAALQRREEEHAKFSEELGLENTLTDWMVLGRSSEKGNNLFVGQVALISGFTRVCQ